MYGHERSLMDKMKGKPFTIVGVNSDDPQRAKDAVRKNNLSWPSFANDSGKGGQISKTWSVEGWPTLYIIDHKGVIREKWLGSPGDETLDKTVEKYVKDAEAEAKK